MTGNVACVGMKMAVKPLSQYADERYIVRIGVVADIENNGTVPIIFRLHSLCLI